MSETKALLVGAAGTDAIPAAVLAAVAAWSTKAALDRRTEPALSPRQVYRAMLVLGRRSAGTTDQQQRR